METYFVFFMIPSWYQKYLHNIKLIGLFFSFVIFCFIVYYTFDIKFTMDCYLKEFNEIYTQICFARQAFCSHITIVYIHRWNIEHVWISSSSFFSVISQKFNLFCSLDECLRGRITNIYCISSSAEVCFLFCFLNLMLSFLTFFFSR